MAAGIQVQVRPTEQGAVLEIEGDLDSSSGPAMDSAYQEAVRAGDKPAAFVSRAGLHQQCRHRGADRSGQPKPRE